MPARTLPILALSVFLAGSPAVAWPTDPAVNVPVCAASGDQGAPRAIESADEGILVAWWDGRAGGQIFAQRLNAVGTPLWAIDGVPVGAPGATRDPLLVPDGVGGAVIAWIEESNGARALKAQRLSAQGLEQWTAGGVTLRTRTDDVEEPGVSTWLWDMETSASDGAGGIYICFHERHQEDNLIDPSRYTSAILVLHCDANGAVAADQVVVSDQYICSFCGDGYFHMDQFEGLQVAANAPEGLLVAYRVRTIINHGTILRAPEIRVAAPYDGWAVTAVTASADARRPRVAADLAGGAYVTWEDTRSGGPEIYASRVSSTGGLLWGDGGIPVASIGAAQIAQEMFGDAGGATVAWLDHRSGSSPDVYAQRLDPSGAPLWGGVGGIPVCTLPTAERTLAIARTDDGSAAIVWRDVRSGSGDIYGRMVNALGVLQGIGDGDPVTSASGEQDAPAIVGTGIHATAVWRDRRGADADVYAQRFAQGPVSGPWVPWTPRLALAWIMPNPTDGHTRIIFSTRSQGPVRFRILDVGGRSLRFLGSVARSAGTHVQHWDGRDDDGREVENGIYFVVMEAEGRRLARRLAVVR